MASESTKDPILDLLFEDLEPEEREALRAEVEGDPEQAEELESFELLMGRVRDADLVEEVPESVHASIMEAARAGASRSGTGPRRTRRGPGESDSIWSRFASGGTGQIALVATVLIAAAFVYQVVGPMGSPGVVGDSAEAPLGQMQPNERASFEGDGFARGESEELAATEEPELESPLVEQEEEPSTDRLEALKLEDSLDELAAAPEEETLLGSEAAEPAEAKQEERQAPVKKRAPARRARKSKSSANIELFGSESAAPSSASGVTSTREDTADKGGADYLSIDDVEPRPKADNKPAAPAADGTAGDFDADQEAYEPPSGSPGAIQQSYDERDYRTTLREANQYLGGDDGNATDRATVMQLKAASLSALGRYAEADRVYQNIQRSYPSFRPAQIKEARADIARQLSDRKRRSKPSPKKANDLDYSDDQMEMEPMSGD